MRRRAYDPKAPLDPAVVKRLESYRCRAMPRQEWFAVRDFAIGTAEDCRPDVDSCRQLALALARIAVYSMQLGHPLTRKAVLNPQNIDSFIRHIRGVSGVPRSGPALSENTIAATISFLERAGRALNSNAAWPPLKVQLSKREAADPYSQAEEDHFLNAARRLEPSNALALVAMGFGAPLTGGALPRVRPSDFIDDGEHLWVRSPLTGILVPVRDRYAADLRTVLARTSDDTFLLGDKYIAKDRVPRIGERLRLHGVALKSSRMMSTWIVRQLSAGVDVKYLLKVLGSKHPVRIFELVKFAEPWDEIPEQHKVLGS